MDSRTDLWIVGEETVGLGRLELFVSGRRGKGFVGARRLRRTKLGVGVAVTVLA